VDEIVRQFSDMRRDACAVVRAADVTEAVAVAERLKALGEAQWFRGQTRDWPKLAPTIWRLPPERIEDAKQQFARLADWAQLTRGLEALSADPDALLAVAQHYGVPTPFVDFTTAPRVAGFFATDGEAPPDGVESVIVCLDLVQARRLWGDLARERQEPVPELVTLDVPNLWRLEAQHGTFVWCPYDSLDAPYRLDRIVFPYSGSYDLPRGDIYPARESPLEQHLNQFFQGEENRGGIDMLTVELDEAGVTYDTLDFDAGPYRAEAFAQAPDPHTSWESASIRPWVALDREYWRDSAAGPLVQLDFWLENPAFLWTRVAGRVMTMCRDDPNLRAASPRWAVAVTDASGEFCELLRSRLQRVWDGMARLPYTSDEIAIAMGGTAALVLARELEDGDNAAAAESLFYDCAVEIMSRSDVRSHACAWARSKSIRAAVRGDFEELLLPSERETTFALSFNLLMTARDPRLLFEFDRLKTLFARELIPTQAALDPEHPPIFSPARVDVIGPA
jgi:hypothetical protein